MWNVREMKWRKDNVIGIYGCFSVMEIQSDRIESGLAFILQLKRREGS